MPGQTKASVAKWPCDTPLFWDTTKWWVVDCIWNVIAHAQKPRFVFRQNGQVHLNWRGHQFSRLVAAEVCASAVVMLDTPCTEVVWRVLAIHSIRQFPLHFSSRVSPCAITFQLDSNSLLTFSDNLSVPSSSVKMCKAENREQLKFTDTVLFFGMLVHHLIFWKKRNISEVGPVSIFTHSTLLYEPLTLISFFNILLTVHLNICVYWYPPTWCTKFYNNFISSLYMFRSRAHRQEAKIVLYSSSKGAFWVAPGITRSWTSKV